MRALRVSSRRVQELLSFTLHTFTTCPESEANTSLRVRSQQVDASKSVLVKLQLLPALAASEFLAA